MIIKKHHEESLLKALIYVESHLDEQLSLEKIAGVAAISSYHFHRLFYFYTGKCVGDYIKSLRLNRATQSLCYSNKPITDIAFNIGYESSSAFTKAFHRKIGVPPREFRTVMQRQVLDKCKQVPWRTKRYLQAKPEYIYREEEKVIFLRIVGDYKKTVEMGMKKFHTLFASNLPTVKRCYGMALDDPLTVEREKCRFDLCLTTSSSTELGDGVGRKVISGGYYAVFVCQAPFSELEDIFTSLFYLWHQKNKHKLRASGTFCEYINMPEEMPHFSEKCVTARYHIPLVG